MALFRSSLRNMRIISVIVASMACHAGALQTTRAPVLNQTFSVFRDIRALEDAGCFHPANQVKNLLPKQGKWLGTILAEGSEESRHDLFAGKNLAVPNADVFRMYKDLDQIYDWTRWYFVEMRQDKLDKGQIIWFDVFPRDWKLCAEGGCDDEFRILALLLYSIKPAQAFVSIGHEIDHNWDDLSGTNDDYVKMMRRAKDLVVSLGGDNAIWKFVVSNQVLDKDDSESWGNMLARWPGDDYVDWIGFNLYLKWAKTDEIDDQYGHYVYGETYYKSKRGHSIEDQLNAMVHKFTKASKPGLSFADKVWEISTTGVHSKEFNETFSDKLGNENLGVPDEYRLEFMKEFTDIMNTDKFPQFKMISYFDTGDSKIDDLLTQPFYDFSTANAFTVNHACKVEGMLQIPHVP